MARGRKLPKSREEKVALQLSEIVNDYNLDLDEVGRYFFRVAPRISYKRIIEIVDVAEMERENADVRNHHHPLF
jgi:hypothetical protein